MKTDAGFTLIELLVTLAVAAIVLTLAVPGFKPLIENNRIAAQSNELVIALNLARSEAVRRQSPVKVCVSEDPDSASCNGSDWAKGWRVQAGDEVLSIHPPLAGKSTLTAPVTSVEYRPTGRIEQDSLVFQLRIPDCKGEQAREIEIYRTGRAEVKKANC